MTYYPRSAWTSVSKGGTILKGSGRTMTHIYIHYPGQGAAIGRASLASTRTRLEGYRRLHKNVRGWADIAYNVAVDQDGNIWELRGIDRQSGANGGTRSNRSGQAILVLVGNNETPTAECVAGIREAVALIRSHHSKADTIRGHQQSPDASTACPGSHLMSLVRSGALEPASVGIGGPVGGASVPVVKPAPKPSKSGVAVDGRWGQETTRALQKRLGVTVDGRAAEETWKALQRHVGAPYVDGIISRQSYRATELGNGIVPRAWKYTGRGSSGSQTIELLQKLVGASVDGVAYEGTTRAVQRWLNHAAGKR